MQLKIQRSQRTSITNKIIFCLDIRADYSPEEQHNIQRYRLGSQGIYNSRAAQKHFDKAQAHLDSTQGAKNAQLWGGLVKGVFSMALAKMQLSVTVASLGRGHHIECKDLEELLESEDTLRTACKNLTRYLEVANTFNGSELVVTYENGEEKVHVTENMPPLLTGLAAVSVTADIDEKESSYPEPEFDLVAKCREIWSDVSNRRIIYAGGAVILLMLLLRGCS